MTDYSDLIRSDDHSAAQDLQNRKDRAVIAAMCRPYRKLPTTDDVRHSDLDTFEEVLDAHRNLPDTFGTQAKKIQQALADAASIETTTDPIAYLQAAWMRLRSAEDELLALVNYAYHVDGLSLAKIASSVNKGRSTVADMVKKQSHVLPVLLAREDVDG